MRRFIALLAPLVLVAPVLAAVVLAASSALADSATAIPETPRDWGTFIRGGLIAAGLYILAMIAGRLWIAWRQRKAKSSGD